jgi:hypothetical protein
MRLYSYVVAYDVGFAPNPFYGYCTLATCKQDIRAQARVGDWVLGTGSKTAGDGDRLVFAMRVEEILTYDDYWSDPRFVSKRPRLHGSMKQQYGDNIYHRDGLAWRQENSRHSLDDGMPNPGHVQRDTKANAVLISREFVYYGGKGPVIPERFRTGFDLVHGARAYRVNFPEETRDAVISWILTDLDRGLQGDPRDWSRITRRNTAATRSALAPASW